MHTHTRNISIWQIDDDPGIIHRVQPFTRNCNFYSSTENQKQEHKNTAFLYKTK